MGVSDMSGDWLGGPSYGGGRADPVVQDYYAILDNAGSEAIGVLAKVDFNNRVEINFGFDPDESMRVFNRWGSEEVYRCRRVTKAEYETYIEFGVPDISSDTSWKKWIKTKPMKWLKKKK